MIPGIEALMHETGVDVGIWAHEHSYERTWPIYDLQVLNGSDSEPYTDPKGIVHIITGSAVSYSCNFSSYVQCASMTFLNSDHSPGRKSILQYV